MNGIEAIQTLGEIAQVRANENPDKTVFIFKNLPVSFGEFDERVNRVARGLVSLGVKPNERICYLGKNTVSYFELLLGASRAGAVMCPINWRLAADEIDYILSNAQAKILFVGPEFEQTTADIKAQKGEALTVIHLADYTAWRNQFPINPMRVEREGADDVLQLYTSGTTGRPKGVCMSNRAMLANRKRELLPETPAWNRWSHDDVGLVSMPCFHIGGTSFGLSILYMGASGVIMPVFDPSAQLDLMVKYGISKQFLVPSALQIMLDDPRAETTDFSKLKYIQYGASPIPQALMKRCIDRFNCGFVQKYGMTETCGSCVALGPEDHSLPANEKMKSVGKPLSGVEIRICDPQGHDLPIGETGEIVIRSPANMSGYWDNEEATKTTLQDGGWLRSGDAGYLDEDGYLYICDRIKDMIVSGGENIYSAEVEAALRKNPAIKQAAVIGIPHERWGEAVMAFIVPEEGVTLSEGDVISHCRTLIAKFKCPKTVEIIKDLPRNASGKVLKKNLRAPYWDGKDRAVN